jgi:hypothetical protein
MRKSTEIGKNIRVGITSTLAQVIFSTMKKLHTQIGKNIRVGIITTLAARVINC